MVATGIMPKLTLTYFGFANRAEPIRLAAAIGKIPFTHRALDFETFKKLKDTLPLGQLPILEIRQTDKDPVIVPEAQAILRYVGKLGGLYPEDPVEALKVDSFVDVVDDASRPIVMTVQGAVRHMISHETEWTAEETIAIRERIVEKSNGFPTYVGHLDKAIARNKSGWLVGDNPTIADLRLYQLSIWIDGGILDGIPSSTLDTYPNVKAHLERVRAIPQVQAWYKKHSPPYGDFEYVPEDE